MPKTVQLSVSKHISVLSLLQCVPFIAVTEYGKCHGMSPQDAGFLRDNTSVFRGDNKTNTLYIFMYYFIFKNRQFFHSRVSG